MGSRGNSHWNTTEVRELRAKLKLSNLQRDVLIGTVLGDGSLIPTASSKNYRRNYRLHVEHCERQKNYVYWLANIFKDWLLSAPKFREVTRSWYFRTIVHPELTAWREIFYRGRKRLIPQDINKIFISPLSLAVWFMDDGCLASHKRSVTFCTHCFSEQGNKRLIDCLRRNFELKVNLNWDGNGFRLYVPVNNARNFVKLVSPYILPNMRYKLPLTP